MSLADHFDGGWLREGWHTVTVKDFRTFQYNTGSDGVEFQVTDDRGQKSKVSFCLVEAALWKLGQFAQACGLTRDQAKKYEPGRENCHNLLVGKQLQVLVVPEGKYHKIDDWMSVDETPPAAPPAPAVQRVAVEEAPTGSEIPF